MTGRPDHRSKPTVLPSVGGHASADAHDPDASPPAGPAALLGNQAVARMFSTGSARPEAVTGLTGLGNQAVARLLDTAASGGDALTPEIAARIDAQRGGGAPLPEALRSPMEQHLRTDLGATRVHTDDSADTLARSLGAEAFTTGNDVFFSAGSYAPQSAAGRELIAHEAVHVAQQQSGRIGYSGRVSDPSDAAEVEARALAPAVARSVEVAPSAAPVTRAAERGVHLAPRTESGPTPTIASWDVVRRSKDGAEHWESDRQQLGDELVVSLFFTGDAQSFGPETASLAGLPQLASYGGRWVRPDTYQITLAAVNVGAADGTLILQVPTLRPVNFAIRADVDMDVQRFLNLTIEANTKVDNNYKAASSWWLGLCIAYGTAYKRHTDALKDQAETDQLVQDLILGAALAFMSGGIGGVVVSAMERKQVGQFLIDGAEELTQFGVESSGEAVPSAVGLGLEAFPTDPLRWQGLAERSVDNESLKVGLQLEAWQHRANANDPTFRLNFDPVAAVESALRIAGRAPVDLPDVDQARTADDFERGMWATWLVLYGYRIATVQRNYVTLPFASIGRDEDVVLDNARKKVVDRCEALGLDITPYMEVARMRAQAEAEARNRNRNEQ
jgi:hypothetical protein